MKKKLSFLILLVALNNCKSDDDIEINGLSKVKIKNLTVSIISPQFNRDYSFHNDGIYGVFENPKNQKIFTGRIDISYDFQSERLNTKDVEVTWISDKDGILFQGNPSSDWTTEIEKKLSVGIHLITLRAKIPSFNLNYEDTVKLSNNIELSATKTGNSVILNWSKYDKSDFKSYKIYTEDFKPIAQINSINTLSFEVKTFSTIVEDKTYQVIVETNENYPHSIGSNLIKINPSIFIDFPYYIHKIIKDPIRPKIYGLVGNKDNDSDVYGIVIIDINEVEYKINSHILKNTFFADLDISPDGESLFLCERVIDKITKINLNTMEDTSFVTNTDGWGFHKIEVGIDNVLFCSRTPPTSGDSPFWIYNGNNGELIKSKIGFSNNGDIEFNTFNNKLYVAHSFNPFQINMYTFRNNDLEFENIKAESYQPYPHVYLSYDMKSLFWESYQLDLDLNVIRTFNTKIKMASPNNKFLLDEKNIYDYNNLNVAYEFPNFPQGGFNSICFSNDHTIIYSKAYQSNTKLSTDPYYRARTYLFKFDIR